MILVFGLVVTVVGLMVFGVYIYKRVRALEGKISSQASFQTLIAKITPSPIASISVSPTPPTPTPTPNPTIVVQATSLPITKKNISYISLVADLDTNSTDWQSLASSEVYIDLKNDYSEGAKVYFEASLHADSSKAWARLFDATHGIGVSGSDIESASLTATLVSSAQLNLWSGRNLYRVQVKSFDSSKVYIESARLKIVY